MYVHKYVTLILDFFKNIRIKFSKFSWKHFKDIFSWDFSFNKIKIYLSFLKPYFSKTFIFFKTYFTLILSYLWSFLRFMVLTKWGWLLLFIAILLTTPTCPFVVGWFNTGCVYLEVFYNKYVVSNQHMKKLASFFRLDVWLKMLFNLDVHEIVAN